MNIPKTLRPFDGAEIQIRCCQESKCNAPKQYRWNQMLAKMDDPRRESIANSSWQQERKNPIDNRMQEQDMGEEIQLGEVEEEGGAAANTAGLGGNTGNARQNQQQLCILPEIAAGQGKNDGHFHLLAAYTIPKLIGPTQLVLLKVPF